MKTLVIVVVAVAYCVLAKERTLPPQCSEPDQTDAIKRVCNRLRNKNGNAASEENQHSDDIDPYEYTYNDDKNYEHTSDQSGEVERVPDLCDGPDARTDENLRAICSQLSRGDPSLARESEAPRVRPETRNESPSQSDKLRGTSSESLLGPIPGGGFGSDGGASVSALGDILGSGGAGGRKGAKGLNALGGLKGAKGLEGLTAQLSKLDLSSLLGGGGLTGLAGKKK